MAVSKRTRFEVLRRDNFTCRYCRSTTNELTIDHVTPTALGGGDDPSNLVAACRDCNAGKTSISPDQTVVADVEADALRWSAALARAAEIATLVTEHRAAYLARFEDAWYGVMPRYAAMPEDEWRATVLRFDSLGLSPSLIHEAVDIAARAQHIAQSARWKYFCGICWAKVRDLQQSAQRILSAQEAGGAA